MGISNSHHFAKMKVLGAVGALCILVCFLQPASAEQVQNGAAQVGWLFGGYSTRTRLSTLSSTIFYTCASSVKKGTTCTGRKKRRVMADIESIESLSKRPLDASEDDSRQIRSSGAELGDSKSNVGKLFIALTTFTTITTTDNTSIMRLTILLKSVCRRNDTTRCMIVYL